MCVRADPFLIQRHFSLTANSWASERANTQTAAELQVSAPSGTENQVRRVRQPIRCLQWAELCPANQNPAFGSVLTHQFDPVACFR